MAELLESGGEGMAPEELAACLAVLTGHSQVEEALPEYVDAGSFTSGVLGLEVAPAVA